jgi:hypothetical protein
MKRRELFGSFLSPSNRHFLHQKCLGRSFPDTLDSSFVRRTVAPQFEFSGRDRKRNLIPATAHWWAKERATGLLSK